MPKSNLINLSISSIWGGLAPSQYFSASGQYLTGIGIDPDYPISDAIGYRQTSGAIRPVGYSSFDGANVNANPIAILTTPKTALVYTILSNGRLITYDSSLGTETLVATTAGGNARGAFYYNNYIYITGTGSSANDVSRWGPLDGTAALTDAVWTGSTLGSQVALGTQTYPSLRGAGTYPNHWGHVHVNNRAYFCDYDNVTSTAANRGRGLIHYIATTLSGGVEGSGNNSSAYNALDLPLGFFPMDIESYGTDIVIAAIQSNNSTLNQGRAALFFWDTITDSFYQMVWLPDPLVTTLFNNNGQLYIFSGPISTGTDVSNGYRISQYLGGQVIKQLYFSESGSPPLQGAVDAFGDRIAWGTFQQIPTTTGASPEYYATVMAFGSKDNRLPSGVHGIINSRATGTATDGLVTALKNVQNASFSVPRFIVGWRDASNFGLDQQSTTYGTAVFRSQMYNIGKRFIIKNIRIPLGSAVAASQTITPTIFLDDFSSASTTGLTVINNTNYTSSQRTIQYYPDISGNHNFTLELRFTGTALLPVLFPIEMTVEIIGD